MKPKFIIVVGTSAGGMNALIELVSQLKDDMDTAVFIVMHLSGTGLSDFLVHRLQPHTSFICKLSIDEVPVQGAAYILPCPVFIYWLKTIKYF